MTERPLLQILIDKLIGRREKIIVMPIEHTLEALKKPQEDFNFFHVFARSGDKRRINNVEMHVGSILLGGELAELTFRELPQADHRPQISLTSIYKKDGIIYVGELGKIVYRGLDEDRRAVFSIAMAAEVDVHSKECPERKHKPISAETSSLNP